jgi:iron complex transport system substrate-binding protein
VPALLVAQNVKRVISLTPSVTDNIYQMGAQSKLVGCTSYCMQALEEGVESVGSAVDVNIEKVLGLQPDVVLTMKLTKAQDVAAMQKLGIRVEVMETPKSFDEICEQTLHIAKIIGAQDNALHLVQTCKLEVDAITSRSKSLGRSKVFFQIGANPIFTVLEQTFMNDFITYCNGQNIAAGMRRGTMTRESVLVKNPDVIIIATMGGFGEDEQKVWNTYQGMKAVTNKKVFLVDSETSCSPTPRNFVLALQDIFQNMSQ